MASMWGLPGPRRSHGRVTFSAPARAGIKVTKKSPPTPLFCCAKPTYVARCVSQACGESGTPARTTNRFAQTIALLRPTRPAILVQVRQGVFIGGLDRDCGGYCRHRKFNALFSCKCTEQSVLIRATSVTDAALNALLKSNEKHSDFGKQMSRCLSEASSCLSPKSRASQWSCAAR